MNLSIKYGTEHLDWEQLCDLIRRAPLGTREPDRYKAAVENSYSVCSAYVDNQLVGFGRAISDGQYQSAIYDVVVLPDFQKKAVGRSLMKALLDSLPEKSTVVLYATPGKQDFYRAFGFGELLTAMGLFANPELSRAKGHLGL
ncbi:MAG: GNAT family N-acetyltransferase [Desulfobacteraceae bacterium]|nr:GNAT family N-acetyltransferase [Desulfobacteraceae bacterium]